MHLVIKSDDSDGNSTDSRPTTEIFGATDFEYDPEIGTVTVWFPHQAIHNDCRSWTGYVDRAVDEAGYNNVGAIEVLEDLNGKEGTDVLVVLSPANRDIRWAVEKIESGTGLEDNVTVVNARSQTNIDLGEPETTA